MFQIMNPVFYYVYGTLLAGFIIVSGSKSKVFIDAILIYNIFRSDWCVYQRPQTLIDIHETGEIF